MVVPTSAELDELVRRLPVRPSTAARLFDLIDDPEASLSQFAEIVELDPVLSARILRLANSAAYRSRGGVASATRAVMMLGSSAVQAIVAAAAFPLLSDGVDLGPDSFWAHAMEVGAAASTIAPELEVGVGDAFTAGLLHDIGAVLLHLRNADVYAAVVEGGPERLLEREGEAFGVAHPEAGSHAVAKWGFPKALVEAVRDHHLPLLGASRLTKAVAIGESAAAAAGGLSSHEGARPLDEVLDECRLWVRPAQVTKATEKAFERVGVRLRGGK